MTQTILQRWEHPSSFDSASNFAGTIPNGYVIITKNRDSSILCESNWECILKHLGGESEHVSIVRHRHWACGWIEYLMVAENAPTQLLDRCVSIVQALNDYPIFNEDDYTERQMTAIETFWQELSLRERMELCRENGLSMFSGRNSYPPDSVCDHLRDSIY